MRPSERRKSPIITPRGSKAAESCEDAIRNAVSIGGDSDTIACMTGSIAEAFYGGIPDDIREQTLSFLDERLRGIFGLFEDKYIDTRK